MYRNSGLPYPGVEMVGASSYLPTEGRYHGWSFGRPDIDPDERPNVERDNRMVAGDYLEAMGIDLVRGRRFGRQDTAALPNPAIQLNQAGQMPQNLVSPVVIFFNYRSIMLPEAGTSEYRSRYTNSGWELAVSGQQFKWESTGVSL